jgi:hypothetical protein
MIQPQPSHPHAANVLFSSHTSSRAIKSSLQSALYALAGCGKRGVATQTLSSLSIV